MAHSPLSASDLEKNMWEPQPVPADLILPPTPSPQAVHDGVCECVCVRVCVCACVRACVCVCVCV